MILDVHRLLLRPGRLLRFMAYWLLLLFIGYALARAKTQGIGLPSALLWCGLFLPLSIGFASTAMLHEPMHRTFTLLLPDARRRYRQSHLAVVIGGATILGSLGYWADSALPLPAFIGLAAAMLSLPLPFEPDSRWAGSRAIALGIITGVGALVWQAAALREFAILRPWLCGLGCLVFVAVNFAVTFSRARIRARAAIPAVGQLTSFLDPEFTELQNRDAQLRRTQTRPDSSSWPKPHPVTSIRDWIGAIQYERRLWRYGGPMLGGFACLGALILYFGITRQSSIAATWYEMIVSPTKGGTYDTLFFVMIVWGWRHWGLRPDGLYPVSRAGRAAITFAASAWLTMVHFSLATAGILIGTKLVAHHLILPFGIDEAVRFVVKYATMLPFLPLFQWCLLCSEVRRNKSYQQLPVLLAIAFALIWSFLEGTRIHAALYTPSGITLLLLAIALSQGAYYLALRRFYRAGDLLQHGTSRTNLGLT